MARTALYPHISKNNIQVPEPGPVEQRSSGRIVLRPGKGRPPSGRLFKYLRVIFPRLAVFSGIQCSERYPALRDVIRGRTSVSGITNYLNLLSIQETCEYRGIDFLEFLRSGVKDIDVFAVSRQKKTGKNNHSVRNWVVKKNHVPPPALPTELLHGHFGQEIRTSLILSYFTGSESAIFTGNVARIV